MVKKTAPTKVKAVEEKKPASIYPMHHFMVKYKVKSPEEGGRTSPAYIGIRWDCRFPSEFDNAAFAIYPDFLDENGMGITDTNQEVPKKGTAKMYINNTRLVHLYEHLIKKGTKIHMVEGKRICAEAEITEVYSLPTNK